MLAAAMAPESFCWAAFGQWLFWRAGKGAGVHHTTRQGLGKRAQSLAKTAFFQKWGFGGTSEILAFSRVWKRFKMRHFLCRRLQ